MQARAKSRNIKISPYKLRKLADVVRGNSVEKAIAWLKTCSVKRAIPLIKVIFSAYSNAKNIYTDEISDMGQFVIRQLRVDVGPTVRYFKPTAMGRASTQRRRLSHLSVVVENKI